MTKLLIQGNAILAADPVEGDDSIIAPDVVYPKAAIPGYAIVEAGKLPEDFSPRAYRWAAGAVQAYSPPPAQADVDELVRKIDADVDGIYADAIGNRQPEYDQANADATAFKNAGYVGTVPAGVKSWADATGWTAQVAADDILAAAAKLTTARDAIRAKRLLLKQSAKGATSVAALTAVGAQWDGFVAYIRGQLNV